MLRLPRIRRDQLDAIKSRVDLAQLVAERGIKLQRKGRHLFALCPFHQEKTPSFVVTPHRGLFHCFGCGLGGDAIGFLVRYDRVSFPEAVRMLAARAGVELEASEPRENSQTKSREAASPSAARTSGNLCGRASWR